MYTHESSEGSNQQTIMGISVIPPTTTVMIQIGDHRSGANSEDPDQTAPRGAV